MENRLQKISIVTEVVGAVAIVISLIFVGIQFTENTKATKSATAASTVATISSWYTEMGNNQQSSSLFYNFMANPDSLTSEERFQVIISLHGLFLTFQNSFYLSQQGTLDSHIEESITKAAVGVKDQPGFRLFWKLRRELFFPEFQKHIDDIVNTEIDISEGLYKAVEGEKSTD
ncbi:hypothetical protein [Fulvivirga sedimenti]|uniref:Uncharacterized protein n=1 Tax=Fulvivirga sedimenti TaxID=2879465 RepID=A0A9X1HVU8_9BACT|nr:hypothetical protein [Fulvivirga sedimenti]MCA6074892.1 hypothetical protein [Fulvivirga sedimenti]MCA6076069.1 hypothetical protein [Fulvivirga sedimenti]MCA6077197.1 hypothetical protein [Fulvivirga sedimenti]